MFLFPRDTRISPPIATESTVTPVLKSLELSTNVAHVSSPVALEQNEEQVNAVVDGSDLEMIDGAAPSKSRGYFSGHKVLSSVFSDEVTDDERVVGSERISSGLTDVVVALFCVRLRGGGAWYAAGEHFCPSLGVGGKT
ncbi:hypothetical protein Tco_1213564 [Tanacetum coccineum]